MAFDTRQAVPPTGSSNAYLQNAVKEAEAPALDTALRHQAKSGVGHLCQAALPVAIGIRIPGSGPPQGTGLEGLRDAAPTEVRLDSTGQ